jgi:hypothetical protein
MAIDFPASPTVGQEHTSGTVVYVWNGTGWTVKGGSTSDLATKVYVDAQDALKVAKAGDTMSGDLLIDKSQPRLRLNAPTAEVAAALGQKNGLSRWSLQLGNGAAETGSDAGSDFSLVRFTDAGVAYGTSALEIKRATGQVLLNGVPAAPLDAMAYNGMQVNGSFDVSQERGDTATAVSYICDGWQISVTLPIVVAASRATNGSPAVPGSPNCLLSITTTAQPSLAAGDQASVRTILEGYRVRRLGFGAGGAQPITFAFWTAHSKTGLYSVSIRNIPLYNRSCVMTYTQNVANTWEYKTITFPGDVTGTWVKDHLASFLIDFAQASGSSGIAPTVGAWFAGVAYAAAGQVNCVSTTSDTLRITGVCILPGTQAPTAAQSPLIMRPFDQELVLCQRYYEKSYDYGTVIGTGTTNGAFIGSGPTHTGGYNAVWFYKTQKRAVPTITLYDLAGNAGKVSNASGNNQAGTVQHIGMNNCAPTDVSAASSSYFKCHAVADARL